jgi:hypothetical protein
MTLKPVALMWFVIVKDEEHKRNGDVIAGCDIVFIAVPTPSLRKF